MELSTNLPSLRHLRAVRFLSNGSYTAMVASDGSGFSKWRDLALNPWSIGSNPALSGHVLYLRDAVSGQFWIASPGATVESSGELGLGVCALSSANHGISCTVEVCVSASQDIEARRVTLRNTSGRSRTIEVTSYFEVALMNPVAFAAHPAFGKLFVQTEHLPEEAALVARRRPRSATESAHSLFHVLSGPGEFQFESDRAQFLGRGGSREAPRALREPGSLRGHAGIVLDPVLACRRTVTLPADGAVELRAAWGAAPTREEALDLLHMHLSVGVFDNLAREAHARRLSLLEEIGLTQEQALVAETLAGGMYLEDPSLRARRAGPMKARGGFDALWSLGLPSDFPVAVVQSNDAAEIGSWLKLQRYWRALGLDTSLLVVSNQALRQEQAAPGVVQRSRADIADAQWEIILSAARLAGGQLTPTEPISVGKLEAAVEESDRPEGSRRSLDADLLFNNGYGGFTPDGSEYVIHLPVTEQGLRVPPAPWINVLANEQFGCTLSETGAGCTWARNSHERRLTPWSNDPVLDPHDEAFYLRDEETGRFWSPLPGPAPSRSDYEVRHGFGYSRFLNQCDEVAQDTMVFVAQDDPVKIVRLTLANESNRERRFSLFAYQRLVLGFLPSQSSRLLVTGVNGESRHVWAENPVGGDFAVGRAFAALVGAGEGSWRGLTERLLFLGAAQDLSRPQALMSGADLLSSDTASDPCFAQQWRFDLAPGETRQISVLIGEAQDAEAVERLLVKYRQPGFVDGALNEVRAYWTNLLSRVRIDTPAPAIDVMVNGWLAYQNLACRVWGRTAFYQSSGAYGFRDQLQDCGALLYLDSALTRKQILIHAEHQFVEGDVLHWWQPAPSNFGLRTHFSDDLDWLPFITAFYVKSTGDTNILAEQRHFLHGEQLPAGEDERGMKPQVSAESGDIYEHCCRALDRSLTKGAHGLPLMGTGDWNDGMNRVGREGRGESVWMGFFLYDILGEFLPFCEKRGDERRVASYRAYRDHLLAALNDTGWDGEWYRRAYFDDGSPLGSKENEECRIDALAQAWSVISGAAPRERGEQAMDEVERQLIDSQGRLIRLLTPPFVQMSHDPGYIKGYVAGVRENGGQYTHAACWVVKAMAELGRTERAAALLEMLSPVSHASTPTGAETFKVEPYVVTAEVYGVSPHIGRGGWSWYTGSAGWLYRVALESVLGLQLRDGAWVAVKPCLPAAWPSVKISYNSPDGRDRLVIQVCRDGSGPHVMKAALDGHPVQVTGGAAWIPLAHDGAEHVADVVLGGV